MFSSYEISIQNYESRIDQSRQKVLNIGKQKQELRDQLNADLNKLDFGIIKSGLTALVQSYRRFRNNTWRTWFFFNDRTRDRQLDKMVNQISLLKSDNLLNFYSYIESDKKYAVSKHGMNYFGTLKSMENFLHGSLSEELKFKIANYRAQIQKLNKEINTEEAKISQLINAQNKEMERDKESKVRRYGYR